MIDSALQVINIPFTFNHSTQRSTTPQPTLVNFKFCCRRTLRWKTCIVLSLSFGQTVLARGVDPLWVQRVHDLSGVTDIPGMVLHHALQSSGSLERGFCPICILGVHKLRDQAWRKTQTCLQRLRQSAPPSSQQRTFRPLEDINVRLQCVNLHKCNTKSDRMTGK
jgi:hypothetical protein